MRREDLLGTLAEEYHVASRNQAWFKHVYAAAYQLNHDPRIQQLTREAPLHRTGYPRVPLPQKRAAVNLPVDEAITRRTSGRRFAPTALRAEQLASLLYLANAVRETRGENEQIFHHRNVPSSGNLGSIEIYPVVVNVDGIEPGIYHFDTVRHDLARLYRGDFSSWLRQKVLFQAELSAAPVALVLTSAFGRLCAKYGLRGYRLGLIDTGHVSQNLYLSATGLGLQVCAAAGFIDDELDRILGLDGLESAATLVLLVGAGEAGDARGADGAEIGTG